MGGCGCNKNKPASPSQAERQAKRLEARATRQEAMVKFKADQTQRMAKQQRRTVDR